MQNNILFEPFKSAKLKFKNRITMTPLFVGYADSDGTVNNLVIEHYAEMAESGAAMIAAESAIVHQSGSGSMFCIRADDDKFIPGLSELASAIKSKGALAVMQINHAGRYAMWSEDQLLGPSVLPDGRSPKREMTEDEIKIAVKWYADAAARIKAAGFDGVEIHGATGYLIVQFFSPRTNLRTDKYGGNTEHRMRFALEVTDAVIESTGGNFPVGYRFIADELVPGGLQPKDTICLAHKLAERGIEYLSVSAGNYDSFTLPEYQELEKKEAFMADYAGIIKKAVPHIPVIAAGRIQTPEKACELVNNGITDFIGLGRVLFTDPLWPRKASGEIKDPISECKPGCINCMTRISFGKPAFCARWSKEKREEFRKKTEPAV